MLSDCYSLEIELCHEYSILLLDETASLVTSSKVTGRLYSSSLFIELPKYWEDWLIPTAMKLQKVIIEVQRNQPRPGSPVANITAASALQPIFCASGTSQGLWQWHGEYYRCICKPTCILCIREIPGSLTVVWQISQVYLHVDLYSMGQGNPPRFPRAESKPLKN